MTDYYKILRVSKEASEIDIKKAYRRLALEFHPDKNKSPNAHDLFVEIVTAYEILSNPTKRAEYDNFIKRKPEHKENNRKETYSTEYNQNYRSQNAEKYANMTYKEFEKFTEQIIAFGKAAKKTTQKGCYWIVAIILFPLGVIMLFNGIFFIKGSQGTMGIILGIVFMFFGFGAYAGATEK